MFSLGFCLGLSLVLQQTGATSLELPSFGYDNVVNMTTTTVL